MPATKPSAVKRARKPWRKRPKPVCSETISVKLTRAQLAACRRAALRAGKLLAVWMRDQLASAADGHFGPPRQVKARPAVMSAPALSPHLNGKAAT
jgi:hypothetical protein